MNKKEMLIMIQSVKLCMMPHPDNTEGSEFEDRINDLEEIEKELEKQVNGADTSHYKALHKHNVNRCASQIPTTWLDPLLTGRDAALTGEAGKWGCPDIENLLRAIKDRIIKHCG